MSLFVGEALGFVEGAVEGRGLEFGLFSGRDIILFTSDFIAGVIGFGRL